MGKSTVLSELASRGYRTVDTDYGGWCVPADGDEPSDGPVQPDWIWDEERMRKLLSSDREEALFVGGCVENQGVFYPNFDEIILLTAAPEVIVDRLRTRASNPYGKEPGEVARVLADQVQFEGVLRRGATLVIDTSASLEVVVESILRRVVG